MLIGIYLRGYKAFNKTAYVPISDRSNFSAYIGDNGVGKSSVLEALDTFFNNAPFNRNKIQQQRGQSRLEDVAFVSPVFLLDDKDIKSLNSDLQRLANAISQYLKEDISSNKNLTELEEHIKKIDLSEKYILFFPHFSHEKEYQDCLFNTSAHSYLYKNMAKFSLTEADFYGENIDDRENALRLKNLEKLRDAVIDQYSFVYVPVEANESDFTKLEGKAVERLTSNDLFKDIADIVKANEVSGTINSLLDKYKEEIESHLDGLVYDAQYRKKFTPALLVEKIIDGYFSTKTLHREKPKVPIRDLSAGEKRQALLSFSTALLQRAAKTGTTKKAIFALDEPESSLHISRVFDQFEKLKMIAKSCAQVIITTHWYGFIPILDEGWVHSFTSEEDQITIESLDLENFYHETRRLKEGSKGKRPIDTNLKGNAELVQSIVNSLIKDKPYNWIICEGVTDAIYIKTFLNTAKLDNVKIIPVAGSNNVIKLYKLLHPVISEYKDQIKTSVVCLIDTDDTLPNTGEVQTEIAGKLFFRRFCNDPGKGYRTALVNEKSMLAGVTTIEDVLPPMLFVKTLEAYEDQIGFEVNKNVSTNGVTNSYQSLDLKGSDREKLKSFFGANNGQNKVLYAQRFSLEFQENPEEVSWLKDLLSLLSQQPPA